MLRGRSGLAHCLERRVLVAEVCNVWAQSAEIFLSGFAQRWMGHGMRWTTDGLRDFVHRV